MNVLYVHWQYFNIFFYFHHDNIMQFVKIARQHHCMASGIKYHQSSTILLIVLRACNEHPSHNASVPDFYSATMPHSHNAKPWRSHDATVPTVMLMCEMVFQKLQGRMSYGLHIRRQHTYTANKQHSVILLWEFFTFQQLSSIILISLTLIFGTAFSQTAHLFLIISFWHSPNIMLHFWSFNLTRFSSLRLVM